MRKHLQVVPFTVVAALLLPGAALADTQEQSGQTQTQTSGGVTQQQGPGGQTQSGGGVMQQQGPGGQTQSGGGVMQQQGGGRQTQTVGGVTQTQGTGAPTAGDGPVLRRKHRAHHHSRGQRHARSHGAGRG